jgi:hypothetical protein
MSAKSKALFKIASAAKKEIEGLISPESSNVSGMLKQTTKEFINSGMPIDNALVASHKLYGLPIGKNTSALIDVISGLRAKEVPSIYKNKTDIERLNMAPVDTKIRRSMLDDDIRMYEREYDNYLMEKNFVLPWQNNANKSLVEKALKHIIEGRKGLKGVGTQNQLLDVLRTLGVME